MGTKTTLLVETQCQLDAAREESVAYANGIRELYGQLEETNRQLHEANVQLDEANKLKSSFLSLISHELRSPFVSIDFALQTLQRSNVENEKELLQQTAENIKTAREMIDRLIACATLLSKQGRLNIQQVYVQTLVNDTIQILKPLADRRGLIIQAKVDPKLKVYGDPERLGEALWHLLHNAIKFSPAGGYIGVLGDMEKDKVNLIVYDSGPGIPDEKQTVIWEAFVQLADSVKRGMEGLGLGLTLVCSVAVAHGGNVMLRSMVGRGSAIGFTIPYSSHHTQELHR